MFSSLSSRTPGGSSKGTRWRFRRHRIHIMRLELTPLLSFRVVNVSRGLLPCGHCHSTENEFSGNRNRTLGMNNHQYVRISLLEWLSGNSVEKGDSLAIDPSLYWERSWFWLSPTFTEAHRIWFDPYVPNPTTVRLFCIGRRGLREQRELSYAAFKWGSKLMLHHLVEVVVRNWRTLRHRQLEEAYISLDCIYLLRPFYLACLQSPSSSLVALSGLL